LAYRRFQQDKTPLFPLAAQKATEVAMNNASLPALTSVGPNYNLRGNMAYQISPHWFAGGFLSANNSRNYASVNAGFSIHYMFRAQPSAVTAPTGCSRATVCGPSRCHRGFSPHLFLAADRSQKGNRCGARGANLGWIMGCKVIV